MFDVARIVGVFQDDDNPETIAVGITSEDGNSLLLEEDDPAVIVDMANRLLLFADEIRGHQAVERITSGNIVHGVDWGANGQTGD